MCSTEGGLAPASGKHLCEYLDKQSELPSWQFRELPPLIDSGNITPTHWLHLRKEIVDAASRGDISGVLVLHGTDTLAYSAAALSFQLLGLEIPVVFTGALLSAHAPGTDAWENLIGSLKVLGSSTLSPNVYLYFHGNLFYGVRCTKARSIGRNPFVCLPHHNQDVENKVPNLPDVLKYNYPKATGNIAVIPFFPGIQAIHLSALIESGVQGLVLECYGSGTGPCDDEAFVAALRAATDRGIVLFAVSQCLEDRINLELYEAGNRLYQSGLISGQRITREAAVGKLQALIGAGLKQEEIAYWLTQNLCGELL
ncbi:MAG: asparaginase [Verrucomicrobia bacterium]|nr:MAG: asparaginase [Verrucomicrobiota bacterium]